jgi:catechol 2,3-dioxygenase-like lactoylglutathione lyase family enzyme
MPRSVLNHVSFGVSDVEKARAFYGPVLKTLGMDVVYDVDLGQGTIAIAYGDGLPELWVQYPDDKKTFSVGNGVHVCLTAPSQKAVDKFHATALKHGGGDAGAPGLRPHYAPDYYAAFIRDPDGNKLEAVYMASMAGA